MTTTENGQRDELLDDILASALANLTDYTDAPREIADTILSEGYRKPRTITTVEELEALPLRSVIVDDAGDGIVYRKMNLRQDGIQWYEPGYLMNWDPDEITLPAAVLYQPEAEAGA